MISLTLDKTSPHPLYVQVYQHLQALILQGTLPPGTRLPTSRALAQANAIARVTVTQAYEQLQAEGYITSRTGAGTFVSEALPEFNGQAPFQPFFSRWGRRITAVAPHNTPRIKESLEIDFGFGRPFSHIFPYDIWRRLLARYLSTDDVMLSRYGSVAGFYPLRQALADYLGQWRGVHCTPEQVVIVSGIQQALDILARLLLNNGDEVLLETPGYDDASELFRISGARLTALPVDEHGFPVEQISPHSHARLAFVTPTNQFPQGGTLSLARRLALLRWARLRDALIIEDDYDGELRYDGRPLAALQGLDRDGRVVYLGSFSKVLFPALRLAYAVLPPALLPAFVHAKGLVDRGAPTLTQAAVADFLAEGHFERHVKHLREAYGRRRETLVAALDRHLPGQVRFSRVPAGLHVMVYLAEGCDETAVIERAAAVGVGVYAGRPYHRQENPPPSILLGFSGLDEAQIEEGVRRLAAILLPEAK